MASTVWKGYLSFGLVSIPIRLFAAARPERVSFNQLHSVCNSRIRQQIFCPTCNKVVERSEIVKGYEFDKGRYVVVEDEELKKIQPSSSSTMEIIQFVRLDEVDPLYFDASYYTAPEEAGRKGYALLLQAMRNSEHAAIAKLLMHQREHTVIIRPMGKGLTLHTLFYQEEVRELSEYGVSAPAELKDQELKLAEQLVATLSAPFEPAQLHDEYKGKVLQMLEAKQQGVQVGSEEPKRMAPVIDLMEALKRSLADTPKKPPARAEDTAEAVAEEARTERKRAPRKRAAG